MYEWYAAQNGMIQQYHIDADESFRELELTTREGQNRCSYEICANAGKLYGLWKELIDDQHSI